MPGNGIADFGSLVKKPEDEIPDYVWTLDFFLDKGVSWHEFKELPMPYIVYMLKTAKIKQDKRERERKKNQNSI